MFLVSRNLRKTLIWIADNEPYHGILHLLRCFTLASSCTFWIRSAWIWYRVFPLGSPTLYMPLGYGTPSRVPWPPANSKTATLSCEICSNPEHESLLWSLQYVTFDHIVKITIFVVHYFEPWSCTFITPHLKCFFVTFTHTSNELWRNGLHPRV